MNQSRIFADMFVLDLANHRRGRVERGPRIVAESSRIVRLKDVHSAIRLQIRDSDIFIRADFRPRDNIRSSKQPLDTRLTRDKHATLEAPIYSPMPRCR